MQIKSIDKNQLLRINIFYKLLVQNMEHYQQFSQAPIFVKKQPFSTVPFQQKYLKLALALSIIKSANERCKIKNLAFSFKQIEISIIKLCSHGSEASLLHKLMRKREDSMSDMHHSQIHKEKSMEILRNIKSSLEKQRIPHSQSARPILDGLSSQKNKILDQITEKLQIKNRIPPLTVQKPIQTLQLNKRVAKLQTFMQQIKKQREMNQKPAFVHEKQKINKINVHMLEEKLNEERKKIKNNGKSQQLFTNIQEIKGQIKKIQQTNESLLKQSQKSIDLSNKTRQMSNQCSTQNYKQRRNQQHFLIKPPQIVYPQQRQQIINQNNVRKIVQTVQPPFHPIQGPIFNFYSVVPRGESIVPPLIIPVTSSPYAKPLNTDRIVYQNVQFSNQQMLRRPKFSFKTL